MNPYNGFTGALRTKAANWLLAEQRAGRRPKPTKCMACSQTVGVIHSHTEDYSEPFGDNIDQYQLCYTCHMMVHCRFKAPHAWSRYVDRVLAGWRAQGVLTSNFGRIQAYLRGGDFVWEEAELPISILLMDIGAKEYQTSLMLASPGA